MAMRLRLWADDPHTPANEMHVELHRVTASSGTTYLVGECDGSACGATLQIGDQVQMGVAGTTHSTYYAHIEIPMEEPAGCSSNCNTNAQATAEQVCPGI